MASTTTSSASQQRIAQEVYPDIDASGATDLGQGEAQTKMDTATTQGYVGIAPSGS